MEARLEENAGAAASRPPMFHREGELWTIAYAGTQRAGARPQGPALPGRAARTPRRGDVRRVSGVGGRRRGKEPRARRTAPRSSSGWTALRDEIEESARWNDLERGERARREREELAAELAATLGLGGRDRRTGTPVARARYSVTKAIRNAVRRIAREHAVLGRHLETTVRTGLYCRYQPDPLVPPRWRVQS